MVVRPPEANDSRSRPDAGFREINRAIAQDSLELIQAPLTDYLVISVFCDDVVHHDVLEWLEAHEFRESEHLYLSRKTIYVHGAPVARVANGKANTSRYGKKIVFHFPGKWFRPVSAGGCALGEKDALRFVRLLCNFLVKKQVAPAGFVRFTGLDRWDCCIEVKTKLTPWQICERITLPERWGFGQGEWSRTGYTVYAGTTEIPKETRSTHPHLAVYQEHERPGIVRIEVRVPRIRNVDPKKSCGEEGAAQIVSSILDCFTPRECAVQLDRDKFGVHPLDFGEEVIPEEYTRRPYSGHAPKTLRRMARQGLTVGIRSLRACVVASLLATPGIMETFGMEDIEVAGLPGPEERRRIDHKENLSYDVEGEDLDVGELRPFDYGATVREIAGSTPLNLDELYELQACILDYQRLYLPGTLPYWEAHQKHSKVSPFSRHAPSLRAETGLCREKRHAYKEQSGELLCQFPPVELMTAVVESDDHWLKRYLEPYDHQPLRTTARWQAIKQAQGLAFYRPDHWQAQATLPLDEQES